MPSPALSIILPVRNARPWIEMCLWSIVRQSMEDWECIVINDHSEDETVSIAKRAADPRIRIVENQGRGIVDALNTGLSQAQGSFISRMDGDDIMPPDKLAVLFDALHGRTDVVATGKVRYFGIESVSEGYRAYERWINERIDHGDHWKWMYRECVIASANWIAHRDNVVFPPDSYPEDYGLTFHWYEKGLEVIGVDHVTHLWREHAQRTSRNADHYAQPAFFRMKVERFFALDRDHSRPLVILGSNVKSKLIQESLPPDSDPLVLDLVSAPQLESTSKPQVLVAVYPDEPQRIEIIEWLSSMDLEMGRDWWWC